MSALQSASCLRSPDAFVHPQAMVDAAAVGAGTRIWAFAHVMSGASIGCGCNVGEHAFIESGVSIGNNVTVKNGISLWSGVTVEDDVFLGPHCVFTNDRNPRAYIKKGPEALTSTRVCRGATIGAGAVIVCGNRIGRFSFVGAGAVVCRDVPDFALVVGNPARQIGWMCQCAHKLALEVDAPVGRHGTCSECGSEFQRTPQGLAVVLDRFHS